MRIIYILAAVAAAVLYYSFLPALWPEPVSRVAVAEVSSLGSDVSVTVTVSAWHPNFHLSRVRIFMEPGDSTALARKRPVEPAVIYDGGTWPGWRASEISRITRPRSRTYELSIPARDYYQRGLIRPGMLRGEVEVGVDYVGANSFGPFEEMSATKTHRFEAGLKLGK